MANCRKCKHLREQQDVWTTRYICGLGGAEIDPEDLTDRGFYGPVECALGGPFYQEGTMDIDTDGTHKALPDFVGLTEKLQAKPEKINWRREYDGKALWRWGLEWHSEGMSWEQVAVEIYKRFGVNVTGKKAAASIAYQQAATKTREPAAERREAALASPAQPASASSDARQDKPTMESQPSPPKRAPKSKTEQSKRTPVCAPVENHEAPAAARLSLRLPGLALEIEADDEEAFMRRLCQVADLLQIIGS